MTQPFIDLVDLASERLGGAVVAANDEFFAPKENLIKPEPAVWIEGKYTERGKWMDGWETRRRREPGDDWCVVRLGVAGVVRGVDVDTAYFKGNYPEACAIEACDLAGLPGLDGLMSAAWREILPRTPLTGDSHNLLPVNTSGPATHLRLRIFPDGCACTAMSSPIGNGCAAAATWTWLRLNTAGSLSGVATVSLDRGTT
jgi:allantoicase